MAITMYIAINAVAAVLAFVVGALASRSNESSVSPAFLYLSFINVLKQIWDSCNSTIACHCYVFLHPLLYVLLPDLYLVS